MTKSLSNDVSLMTTGVKSKLALIVVCLAIAAANWDRGNIRGTRRGTFAVWTTYFRAMCAGIALQFAARVWYFGQE